MSAGNGNGTVIDFTLSMVGYAEDTRTVDTTFRASMEAVRTGRWRAQVEELRAAYSSAYSAGLAAGLTGRKLQDAIKEVTHPLKMRLAGFLFSGTFSYRAADKLLVHTPAICADLDHLENVEGTRDLLIADPYVLAIFVSPTGTGLKVIFRIDPARPHIESYIAAETYVRETHQLTIDHKCKDVNRLCFVSYDPDCFIAETAEILPYPPPPPIEEPREPSQVRRNFPAGYISVIDDFNARGDWRAIVKAKGWTEAHEPYWTRPGKKHGTSASWDVVPGAFHVFTDAAPPLIDRDNYDPFDLYKILECGGDQAVAIERLYELGYGSRRKPKSATQPTPDPDSQAAIDAASEGESQRNGEIPSDETLEEQMARITEDYNRRAAKDSPPGDPTANGTAHGEKSPLPRGWPEPISAADLCANPPPKPEVLIEGILYAAGTMLVAGPSKSMKTFSALDVALAISSGGKWMGRQCAQSSVLYLNLELQDFATEERIARICSARGIQPPANFHTWNLRGQTVSLAALVACLPDYIARYKCKIVCIDPHYKISSVSDMEENSNDSQGKLLTLLEGLCCRAGAALTITHHFAKGDAGAKNAIDRASGGGVFARWGDVMMTFTPHEEGDAMTVEMALRNFAPVKPFVVRWEYPRWVRDDNLDPAKLKKKPSTFTEQFSADDLLLVLGDQLLTSSEWEKKSRMKRSTYYGKRSELLESKRVEQVGSCFRKC